jgi:hypothetical protein
MTKAEKEAAAAEEEEGSDKEEEEADEVRRCAPSGCLSMCWCVATQFSVFELMR